MNELLLAKNSKCFKGLSQLDFTALLRCFSIRIKTFKPGEIIEYYGNRVKYIYILLNGRARTIGFNDKGVAMPLIDYTKDMAYGIDYGFSKSRDYAEEFVCVEESTMMILNIEKALNPCENKCPRHDFFLKYCMQELANKVHISKTRIFELGSSKTRNKVLVFLENQIKEKNVYHTIPYNRQEMADYLGVERSALSAELSTLKKEGLIDFNKSIFMLK